MIFAPSFARPGQEPPQREADGVRRWIVRAANFVIDYIEAAAGAEIPTDTCDEHIVYLTDGVVSLSTGGDRLRVAGEGLAIVPPGRSVLRSETGGAIVRLFTDAETALAESAANAAAYADARAEVATVAAWPEPVGGYALRGYALADVYARGAPPFVFCTRKLMAVPYPAQTVPRDATALSPHAHADFEQGSVALGGRWVHHLRVPWSADRRQWRDDVHEDMESPSIVVIPAGTIHTSQSLPGAPMRLLDVFSPPRADFAAKPGAVRNADIYPRS